MSLCRPSTTCSTKCLPALPVLCLQCALLEEISTTTNWRLWSRYWAASCARSGHATSDRVDIMRNDKAVEAEMTGAFNCPACGFCQLEEPAWDQDIGSPSFNICPCCGCEFGYNDATPQARERHLRQWIRNGAAWFRPELKPVDWSLEEQLRGIGHHVDHGCYEE